MKYKKQKNKKYLNEKNLENIRGYECIYKKNKKN